MSEMFLEGVEKYGGLTFEVSFDGINREYPRRLGFSILRVLKIVKG